eukprot:11928433-Ditylum_brightwellii.AAC.1
MFKASEVEHANVLSDSKANNVIDRTVTEMESRQESKSTEEPALKVPRKMSEKTLLDDTMGNEDDNGGDDDRSTLMCDADEARHDNVSSDSKPLDKVDNHEKNNYLERNIERHVTPEKSVRSDIVNTYIVSDNQGPPVPAAASSLTVDGPTQEQLETKRNALVRLLAGRQEFVSDAANDPICLKIKAQVDEKDEQIMNMILSN